MGKISKSLFFIGLLVVAVLAGLLLLPGLKEGYSWSEAPFGLGVIAALSGVGYLWWRVCGQSLRKSAVGFAVLSFPFVAYVLVVGSLVFAQVMGTILVAMVSIENYQESEIMWDGFDGPVGMKIEFDLIHPRWASGLIYPPEIRMGPFIDVPDQVLSATYTSGGGVFKDTFLEEKSADLVLLKTVLFQKLYGKGPSARRFEEGSKSQLVYYLHPGLIDYLETSSSLCLIKQRKYNASVPHQGENLSALWMVAGSADMVADLSSIMTETVRRHSSLQENPTAWVQMQKRLRPDGLAKAGYVLCEGNKLSKSSFRDCYCRS